MYRCISDDDCGFPSTSELTLNLDGLEALGTYYVYEDWVIGDSVLLYTGTFTAFNTLVRVMTYSRLSARPTVDGENFFENKPEGEIFPLDARCRTVVISVEPVV